MNTLLSDIERVLNNRKLLGLISFLILTAYLSPLFIHGEDLYLKIYDNLDSNVIWLKILAESGMIFANSMEVVPNMMGGLPRISYGTEFSVLLWLYVLLEPFHAYSVNEIIIHLFAFFSMFTLLSNYFIDKDASNRNLIIFSVSLVFALVPFWPAGGVSIPSLPLATYSFLNIYNKKDTKKDWIILLFIPFYSVFVLSYFFYLLSLGFFFLYDTFRLKRIHWKFLSSILLMTTVSLLIDYRLVLTMLLDNSFVSHREEFLLHTKSLYQSYKTSVVVFFNGNENQMSEQFPFLLPFTLAVYLLTLSKSNHGYRDSVFIIIIFGLFTYFDIWRVLLTQIYSLPILFILLIATLRLSSEKMIAYLILLQLAIAFWSGFWFYEGWKSLFPSTSFIEKFNFTRFLFLQPLFWYILLALSAVQLSRRIKLSSLSIILIISSILYAEFKDKYFIYHKDISYTYKAYFAEDLFDQIDKYIAKDKSSYRVGSIAIEPAVALYNGFYTIDGYSANYPLEYKHKFSDIIKANLEHNLATKKLFLNWGSKCYLFGKYSYEANMYNKETILPQLDLNMQALRDMNTSYLISPYKIEKYTADELRLLSDFSHAKSHWDIYLYEIIK